VTLTQGANVTSPSIRLSRRWWVKYYQNGRGMRESSHSRKESVAKRLLKLREGDIEHGLPVNPKLNRIRFDEAAEDLKREYAVNGRRSADELERRIRLHLIPAFGGRRLAAITTPEINTFMLKRQADVIVMGEGDQRKERNVSNGEINRELTTLKRIFNLARQNGKLIQVPHIPMLKERNVRTGFFERAQLERVLNLLPPAVRPAVQFAYITGWRIPSEVLPLQWRHVDFEAHVVRLDPHTTKNDEGRTFPVHRCPTRASGGSEGRARPLESRRGSVPLGVPPNRQEGQRQANHSLHEGLEERMRESWNPGRIPHDLRRTAVRNLGGHPNPTINRHRKSRH
jgi:integrase